MDLQSVIEIDRQLLGVFNGHHSMFFDTLMVTLTSGVTWIPLHVVNNRRGLDYSFFSAHASNTFGIAMFFCLLVRNRVFSWLMVTWSLVNCYTRLYLAMHYPSDILVGLAFGACVGSLVYGLYRLVFKQISPNQHYISSQYTSSGYSLADVDVVACVLVLTYLMAIVFSLTMH